MDCLAGQTDREMREMASSNTNQLKNNVIFTEDDIPGAKTPRESSEHCRIWRMCPAKQSMHALRSQFGPSSRSFCNWRISLLSYKTLAVSLVTLSSMVAAKGRTSKTALMPLHNVLPISLPNFFSHSLKKQ